VSRRAPKAGRELRGGNELTLISAYLTGEMASAFIPAKSKKAIRRAGNRTRGASIRPAPQKEKDRHLTVLAAKTIAVG